MTRQESFKQRIRARMEKTGERYAAARRVLISQAGTHRRTWHAQPEVTDEAVGSATGKEWDDWCDEIEAWPGHVEGHAAIAAHLVAIGVDPWWAQTVTVGYERITGVRLPYQRPDGTFTAGKSQTIGVDATELRTMLLDDAHRAGLFPGFDTLLRSKPSSKSIRIAIGPGVAELALTPIPDGRTKVAVSHDKLPNFDDVEEWKFYWSEWLDAVDESADGAD